MVGDGDVLELLFLDDDIEVIVDVKDYGVEVYGFNVVGFFIICDFINNNFGFGVESFVCLSGVFRVKFILD